MLCLHCIVFAFETTLTYFPSMQRLQQMVRMTRPGDVLFFSFSGYGLQAMAHKCSTEMLRSDAIFCRWTMVMCVLVQVQVFINQNLSCEVDDMDGYQDDGFEEAILPTDFVDGRDGDYSVICTNDLHDAGHLFRLSFVQYGVLHSKLFVSYRILYSMLNVIE